MTTCLSIVTSALRVCRVIGAGQTPPAGDAADAMSALQRRIRHLAGYGAAYPYRQRVVSGSHTIHRDDMGADCVVTATATLTLPENPRPGARVRVRALPGVTVTVARNGLLIAGAASDATVSAGAMAEWMFRDDLGSWNLISALSLSDEMPYPDEFDDAWIYILAAVIGPEYGSNHELSQTQIAHAQHGYTRLAAKYVPSLPAPIDPYLMGGPGPVSLEDVQSGAFLDGYGF